MLSMRSIVYAAAALLAGLAWPAAAMDYVLGSGDLVHITVYDHPELQLETPIDEDGRIDFPLAGGVVIAGKSPGVAQRLIAESLEKGGYIKQPQVNLLVKEYRSKQVSVLGHVNKPGKYPLEMTSTVSDLLAQAGGVSLEGADELTLIRNEDGKPHHTRIDIGSLFLEGQAGLNQQVVGGDVIFVPRAPMFYIYGEVRKPGAFRLEKNMNVMQALSLGGGITPRGTQRGIQIRRQGEDGRPVSLKAALTDGVREDDVVYVKESLF